MGLGGLLLVLVASLIFKQDFFSLLSGGDPGTAVEGGPVVASPEEEQLKEFITFVLNDVQATWDQQLPAQAGSQYQHATLVLFRDATGRPAVSGEAAMGPFYCPGDNKVYIDLGFYQALHRARRPWRLRPGYVLAHEIGHHLQFLLGVESQVRPSAQPARQANDCRADGAPGRLLCRGTGGIRRPARQLETGDSRKVWAPRPR